MAKAEPPKSQVDLTALLESCRVKREASERARMARYRQPVSQAPRRPPSTEATPTPRAPTPPGYPSPPTGGPQNLSLRDAVPMAIPEASEIHEMVRKHRIYMEDMEEWRHEFNAAMEARNVRLKALKESYGLK
ncbi:hypothetical protein IWQ60_004721 [Tieghemiomyces parasiticus]|uniref:Uncharacterized protein n=1 Tax=Tieghemiomyces parasiticus TaxID=78921 RepID=A0A9W8ADS7_9FUNG|nr:hypothetical protein IWQ60_004721 [Tieghemiomyces parasiticus]